MALRRRETYHLNGTVTVDEIEIPDEIVREETLQQRAEAALVDLRALANTTGNLSSAQLSNAVRLLARVTVAIVRLHLRRFEAVD